jgi:hypothetical protein
MWAVRDILDQLDTQAAWVMWVQLELDMWGQACKDILAALATQVHADTLAVRDTQVQAELATLAV